MGFEFSKAYTRPIVIFSTSAVCRSGYEALSYCFSVMPACLLLKQPWTKHLTLHPSLWLKLFSLWFPLVMVSPVATEHQLRHFWENISSWGWSGNEHLPLGENQIQTPALMWLTTIYNPSVHLSARVGCMHTSRNTYIHIPFYKRKKILVLILKLCRVYFKMCQTHTICSKNTTVSVLNTVQY